MLIYLLMMATAFFGYVLPWGQMSFWGATVITNLFTAFDQISRMLGTAIATWLWGDFARRRRNAEPLLLACIICCPS